MPPLGSLILGFDGPSLPDEIARLLADGMGGVALFARNLVDRQQVRDLCSQVRSAARGWPTPIISIDQEGGRVQRLRRLSPLHPAAGQLAAEGLDACREAGRSIGLDLADLGINLDFAPVLDVDTNPANPIIGDRAFGRDPSMAAASAVAFLKGLQSTGVAGCGKHFPGHGDASADSHLELPVIHVDADTMGVREELPFVAAIRAGIPAIMTAHCLYPAIDSVLPATLSFAIVQGRLRERLGFSGCVITDDLGMKAIADGFQPSDVLDLGLLAGVDMFLHCGGKGEWMGLVEALLRGQRDKTLPQGRIDEALARAARLRTSLS